MSAATKRKHVVREITESFVLPENDEFIALILAGKGNNLHEVKNSDGEKFLVSMPTKFRKNVWIKRGDFVICSPIDEGEKVKAEIVRVLIPENIKFIRENNFWPKSFDEILDSKNEKTNINDFLPPNSDEESDEDEENDEEDEEFEEFQVKNPNRGRLFQENSEENVE